MKHQLSVFLAAFLIFSSISPVPGASAAGNSLSFRNVPSSVYLGNDFRTDMYYQNQSGQDLYIGSCAISWGWSRPKSGESASVGFKAVTFMPPNGSNFTPTKLIDYVGGGGIGETGVNIEIMTMDGSYASYLVQNGQSFTTRITFSQTADIQVGDVLTVDREGSGCAVYEDPETSIFVALVPVSASKTINVVAVPDPDPEPTPVPSPTPEPSPTPTPQEPEEEAIENSIKVESQEGIQVKVGDQSIEDLSGAQLEKVSGLQLSVAGRGSILFSGELDLSAGDTQAKFGQLDDYVQIGDSFVEVDSGAFSELNVAATITFENLDLDTSDGIGILKDEEAAGDAVGDIDYYPDTKTLTFNVTGFSRYEVDPEIIVSEDLGTELGVSEEATAEVDAVDAESSVAWFVVGGVVVLLTGASLGGYFWYKKKHDKKVKKEKNGKENPKP